MYPDNNNDTAVNWILGLSLFFIVVFVLYGAADFQATSTGENREIAEKEAKIYLKDLGVDFQGVVCSPSDSDGNGYVSCSVNTGKPELMQIECIKKFSAGNGCRPLRVVLPTNTTTN